MVKKNSMAKILSQNYSYANNSSGELIHVSTAQRCEEYFCPICGELMTTHMGKVRRWHFVHKNAGNCSYESYLHKLAKIKIQQAFSYAEHFWLSYKAKAAHFAMHSIIMQCYAYCFVLWYHVFNKMQAPKTYIQDFFFPIHGKIHFSITIIQYTIIPEEEIETLFTPQPANIPGMFLQ